MQENLLGDYNRPGSIIFKPGPQQNACFWYMVYPSHGDHMGLML